MASKYQNWSAMGYPDSLPADWIDRIIDTHIPMCISPIHDKDRNPDGTEKKAHYHIIIMYDNPTTEKHIQSICDSIGLVLPRPLNSVRGMFRYHLHLDNPEKFQYDDRDRQFFNGFDISRVAELTKTEISKIENAILEFIDDNLILEYSDLLRILRSSNLTDMLEIAKHKTILLNTYITSKRNKLKELPK